MEHSSIEILKKESECNVWFFEFGRNQYSMEHNSIYKDFPRNAIIQRECYSGYEDGYGIFIIEDYQDENLNLLMSYLISSDWKNTGTNRRRIPFTFDGAKFTIVFEKDRSCLLKGRWQE